MEKLVATHGCPGLYYLNTSKQYMAIINFGLSGLALSIDPNTKECLLSKVLKSVMSMKEVINVIEQYDK